MTTTPARLCVMLALIGQPTAAAPVPVRTDPTVSDTSFTSIDGHVFDARLYMPPKERCNGLGMLMLGGGMGNDLDWTTPGHLELDGRPTRITISGEPHADAPVIATAMASRGFVVMHYTTIRRGDPKADRWPYEATVYTVAQHLALARSALARLRAEAAVTDGRVYLLGHSMGGQRRCALAADDDHVDGLILLASAQATVTGPGDRGRNVQRGPTAAIMSAADVDDSGFVDRLEFDAWSATDGAEAAGGTTFETIDFDDDGRVRPWEFSAALARLARRADPPADDDALDAAGVPFSEFVLRRRKLPTLFLYGELDESQGYHAPALGDLIDQGRLGDATVVVLPGIGHLMGPEVDGRFGPVDDTVLAAIAGWLDR